MNEELKTMFGNGVTVGTTTIPVAHINYKGSSLSYITWVITGETPVLCADDVDVYSAVNVDVDVYSNGNITAIVSAVKTLFRNNSWIWEEDSIEMYEQDTKMYHKTISFTKGRYI